MSIRTRSQGKSGEFLKPWDLVFSATAAGVALRAWREKINPSDKPSK